MAYKQRWQDRCLAGLYRFYPQLKGKAEFIDCSTPLSIEHYLRVPKGGAVGLGQPGRYDANKHPELLEALDMVTPIPGLYMTGQDTLLCGVVLAQAAGIITAFRVMGLVAQVHRAGISALSSAVRRA